MDIGPLEYIVIGVPDPTLKHTLCSELNAIHFPLMGGGLGYLLGSNNANQQVAPQAQQAAAPPVYQPPPASASDDVVVRIKRLAGLHDSDILTDEEFASAKKRILEE